MPDGEGKNDPSRPPAIGVVGFGWFARLIAQACRQAGSPLILAAADPLPQARAAAARDYAIPFVFDDFRKLLECREIEAVIIAVPPSLQHAVFRDALAAGKHVFCEKPGALDPAELDEVASLGDHAGLRATVDFVMRRHPLYMLAEKLVRRGLLGAPERASLENFAHAERLPEDHWFWDRRTSGGIWVEHGVHFFDVARWFFGPMRRIAAAGSRRPGPAPVEDRAVACAEHERGVVVSYYHSFTRPERLERTRWQMGFSRGYLDLEGWIPTHLSITGLLAPEQLAAIEELASSFSTPEVPLETTVRYGAGDREFAVVRCLAARDRWHIYRVCIHRGIAELFSPPLRVTVRDAAEALRCAVRATTAASR